MLQGSASDHGDPANGSGQQKTKRQKKRRFMMGRTEAKTIRCLEKLNNATAKEVRAHIGGSPANFRNLEKKGLVSRHAKSGERGSIRWRLTDEGSHLAVTGQTKDGLYTLPGNRHRVYDGALPKVPHSTRASKIMAFIQRVGAATCTTIQQELDEPLKTSQINNALTLLACRGLVRCYEQIGEHAHWVIRDTQKDREFSDAPAWTAYYSATDVYDQGVLPPELEQQAKVVRLPRGVPTRPKPAPQPAPQPAPPQKPTPKPAPKPAPKPMGMADVLRSTPVQESLPLQDAPHAVRSDRLPTRAQVTAWFAALPAAVARHLTALHADATPLTLAQNTAVCDLARLAGEVAILLRED